MDHPLKDSWSFWSLQRSSNLRHLQPENYENYLKKVSTVSTVQQFWTCYSHLRRSSEMPQMYDIHLFRSSIRPVWEDAQNAAGGKITLRLKKGLAERLWEQLLLVLIGEEYQIIRDVCGAIISSRYNEDIISIWIANSDDHEMLKEFIKKSLSLPVNTAFDYKPHNLSIKGVQGNIKATNKNGNAAD